MTTINKHLFNALDNYPYSLVESIESLEYAFSYDNKNTMALCLLGRMYAEQLSDYETAKECFEEALSYNIHSLEIYPHYIQTLVLNEDFEEAEKLIQFALTVKGINKIEILLKKLWILEIRREWPEAKELIRELKLSNCNSNYNGLIDEVKARIESKIKMMKIKKIK